MRLGKTPQIRAEMQLKIISTLRVEFPHKTNSGEDSVTARLAFVIMRKFKY